MAIEITKLTPNKLVKATVNTGASFEFKMPKDECIIVAEATASGTLKVLKPTKPAYAAALKDLELTVASGDIVPVCIESARYANTDGTVKITAPAGTKLICCE